MADHAKLSASSAERWINCPGSVHMASLFPPSVSKAAAEGTLAHELADLIINNKDTKAVEKEIEKFYKDNPDVSGSLSEMDDNVTGYAEFVLDAFEAVRKKDSSAMLATEQRVHFEHIVPDGFGTSDAVIIGNDEIHIIDLKYGKGVEVSAAGNPQMRLYALGAIDLFELMYDFKTVVMTIYQPRRDNVSTETISVEDLKAWADEVARPAAKLALSNKPPYHPGEWCSSHFCPGAGACKARAEYCLALERHYGKDPALLTDEEIADAIGRAEELAKWAKALGAYALDSALNGHKIPGYKVVEGRANRVYKSQDDVANKVISLGFDPALIYNRTLIGITDMEKLLGKKKFNEVLGDLVIKPQGAPKLVPEEDKRADFKPDLSKEFD